MGRKYVLRSDQRVRKKVRIVLFHRSQEMTVFPKKKGVVNRIKCC